MLIDLESILKLASYWFTIYREVIFLMFRLKMLVYYDASDGAVKIKKCFFYYTNKIYL